MTNPYSHREVLGDAPEVSLDSGEPEERDATWGHPSTLALAALLLAVLMLMGASAFQGRGYALGLYPDSLSFVGDDEPDVKKFGVLAAALDAAFFLIPLLLGMRALRRLLPSDGARTGHVARVAVLLSALGLVLGTVQLVIAATTDQGPQSVFL